jgi:hypothetical protein
LPYISKADFAAVAAVLRLDNRICDLPLCGIGREGLLRIAFAANCPLRAAQPRRETHPTRISNGFHTDKVAEISRPNGSNG